MRTDPDRCNHAQVLLIIDQHPRVRCRRCHLTMLKDELGDGYCPECWQERHEQHHEFDPVETGESPVVRYRCEVCGSLLEPLNG